MAVFIYKKLLLLRSQGSRCLGTTGTNPSAPANPWNSTDGMSSNFLCQTDALAPLGPNIHLTGNLKTPDNNTHSGQTRRARPTPYRLLITSLGQSSCSPCSHPIHQISSGHSLLKAGLQAVHPCTIQMQPILGKQLGPRPSTLNEVPIWRDVNTRPSRLSTPFLQTEVKTCTIRFIGFEFS